MKKFFAVLLAFVLVFSVSSAGARDFFSVAQLQQFLLELGRGFPLSPGRSGFLWMGRISSSTWSFTTTSSSASCSLT